MSKASLRRSLIVLVVVVGSGISNLEAAPMVGIGNAWGHLGAWIDSIGVGSFGKSGCTIVPDGKCQPLLYRSVNLRSSHRQPAPQQVKSGCSVDPNGKPNICTP